MLVVSRGALLVATASLAAGLLAGPSAAFAADTSTPLSAAEMSSALKAIGTASGHAAARGWTATLTLTGNSLSTSESFVVDPVGGVTLERTTFGGQTMTLYVAGGRGTYTNLADPMSRAAVKMMHRSSVRYVFLPDKSRKTDTEVTESGVSPATMLADDTEHEGTRTTHDDGSADYRMSQDGTTVTVHATADGLLRSADADSDGQHFRLAYTYGSQHVKLPSAAATISSAELARGMAYLSMAASVKQVAGQAATDALRAAHGRSVSVSSLRKVALRAARMSNADNGVKMIKTRNVGGGLRLYATNPWTHRTVSYTLTASGRKVTIAKK